MHYRLLLVGTFLLTVIFDLVVAIEVGLLAAGLLFITRVASVTRLDPIALPVESAGRHEAWRVFGSLFFGSTSRLEPLLTRTEFPREALILDLHQMINLDTTGLDSLRTLERRLREHGCRLVLVAPNEQPLSLLTRSGFRNELGPEAVHADLVSALSALDRQAGASQSNTGLQPK
jgi:SulP family sulfate permease